MKKEIRITINNDGSYRVKVSEFTTEQLMNSVGALLKSAYDFAIEANYESDFKKYMNGIIESVYDKSFAITKSTKSLRGAENEKDA